MRLSRFCRLHVQHRSCFALCVDLGTEASSLEWLCPLLELLRLFRRVHMHTCHAQMQTVHTWCQVQRYVSCIVRGVDEGLCADSPLFDARHSYERARAARTIATIGVCMIYDTS